MKQTSTTYPARIAAMVQQFESIEPSTARISTEKKSNSTPAWSVAALSDMLYEYDDEEYGSAIPFINTTEETVYFEANGFLVRDFADSSDVIDNLIDAIQWLKENE